MITSFEKCSTVISASEKNWCTHTGVFLFHSIFTVPAPPLSGPAVLFVLSEVVFLKASGCVLEVGVCKSASLLRCDSISSNAY